ncbi:MAG: LysM peptidoglycan-binding domain-containing protein [Roseburia sp.]|nr:LysM peptidoglycan-binding domain-containing protein [Anaeroplasma bactoclasticum]MCM1195471.1 LysM peptidoglycan-binding domain-containing protein [Roseburia sp.]MCM1555949.1 LysM peptidoglycan-binding domain-containing protein [Anaeroplasma bactoclasticum]
MNYYNPIYSTYDQYIVKQNDSLYMIAKKYGVSVEDLKNTNHLVSNMIYPNQILFIPKKQDYVTKTNDSVQGLINKYNLNYLDLSNLKVAPNQPIPFRTEKVHIVGVGECIEDILSKYQLSPLDLLKLNEDKLLVVGEKIIIEK